MHGVAGHGVAWHGMALHGMAWHTAKGASFVQTLLQIADEASVASGGSVDWSVVIRNVARVQLAKAQDIPHMVDFVKMWGGLPDGSFIHELNEEPATATAATANAYHATQYSGLYAMLMLPDSPL